MESLYPPLTEPELEVLQYLREKDYVASVQHLHDHVNKETPSYVVKAIYDLKKRGLVKTYQVKGVSTDMVEISTEGRAALLAWLTNMRNGCDS